MRILLLAQENIYSDIVIQKFLTTTGHNVAGLIFSSALLSGQSSWKSLNSVLKKGGWGILIGKFINMVFAQAPKRQYPFLVFKIKDINSPESLKKIQDLRPDVIFSIFFNQILHAPILNIPSLGAVNIHPAYLPEYRGIGPTFWALANGETELGVTYHYINGQIDAGDIIHREKVNIREDDSVHSLYLRCAQKAAELLPEVFKKIEKKDSQRISQNLSESSYYGLPDKEGYRRLRRQGRSFMTLRDIKQVLKKNKEGLL